MSPICCKGSVPDGFVLQYVMYTALIVYVWVWFLAVLFSIILDPPWRDMSYLEDALSLALPSFPTSPS
jgi:hypothetical protein